MTTGLIREIRDLVECSRGQSLSELAFKLAIVLARVDRLSIGVTGPSSVGKTYFANDLAKRLEANGRAVTVIGSDSFLLPHLRGAGSFRADTSRPLMPEDFDVVSLAAAVDQLRQGVEVEYATYIRGVGWQGSRTFAPADFIVVEGLFLDSVYISRQIPLEVVLILAANEQLIGQWRRERDEKIQQAMSRPFRNWVETEKEIARTQRADDIYEREELSDRLVVIDIDAERKVFDFPE